MSREVDRRDFRASMVTPERETELRSLAASVSEALPGAHQVAIERFDPATGNAGLVTSEAAPAGRSDYVQRALDHVRRIAPALGLEATQPVEYAADPAVQRTSAGAATVHLQQRYKGIPVFEATQAVRFGPEGELEATAGRPVTVPSERHLEATLPATEAVLRAARHVAVPDDDERGATDQFGQPLEPTEVDLAGWTPGVVTAFPDRADRPTVLTPGPFAEPIRASLAWLPLTVDDLRLCWQVMLAMPGHAERYRLLVDAGSGEVLYCRQLARSVRARGAVFLVNGDQPRQLVDFPRALAELGLPLPEGLPVGFPDDWVAADRTAGNCVVAHAGDDGVPVQGQADDGGLRFEPADQRGSDQRVLNLFCLTCYMHDWFYLLGFREADGNFQLDDFGRGGVAQDPVDARAYDGPVWATASMRPRPEGTSPVMRMGLVESTGLHTALDASVVFHEFTHGVSDRLVGGPLDGASLEEPQSAGLGEGWSDFVACAALGTRVIAAWVTGLPGGIRGFPYDGNFPDSFGDLGTGRYTEVHAIGEIWCAALVNLADRIGSASLVAHLVVDGLKLTAANPSFLDSRDAILLALDHRRRAGLLDSAGYSAALRSAWAAFARFGMGPDASSNGPSLFGVRPDFDVPDLPAAFEPAEWQAPTPPGGAPPPVPDELAPDAPGEPVSRELPDRHRYATFMVELLLDEVGEVRRTRVVHLKNGGQEGGRDTWPGWESGRLVRYFVEHAELREPVETPAGEPPDVRVEITSLGFETLGGDAPRPRMQARVAFRVAGGAAADLARVECPYFLHVLAYLLGAEETVVLAAEQGRLRPGTLECATTIEFSLPAIGRYQLLGTVVLPSCDVPGVAVGPVLRVVP